MLPTSAMLTIKKRAGKLSLIFLATLVVLAGCGPPGPQALLKGQRLIERGDYAEAVAQLQTATTLMPTNAHAWNYLGVACQHAGQAAEAERAYQRAIALDHDLSEAHYNLGCLWLEQNKPAAARGELITYTFHRANSVPGLIRLGEAQTRAAELEPTIIARTREWTAAEKSLLDALHLEPDNAEAFNALGMLQLQRGRITDANQSFASALKHHPDYVPALLNSAIVAQQYLRDPRLALQKYRAYLALRPAPPDSASVAEIARELEFELLPTPPLHAPAAGSTTGALSSARTIHLQAASSPEFSLTPTNPKLASNLTPSPGNSSLPPGTVLVPPDPALKIAHDASSQTGGAAANSNSIRGSSTVANSTNGAKASKPGFFHRLFSSGDRGTSPTNPPTAGSADPFSVTSNPASTETASNRYAYRKPTAPIPGNRAKAQKYFAQGVEEQKAGKLREAIQSYRTATQVDPSFYDAYYNLGGAATASGDTQIALISYEYALAARPDAVDARFNFALALKQANCVEDAANELEKILAVSPKDTRAHLALGFLCSEQLHQTARAREHYQKVLELEPHHPQSGAIRAWLTNYP
jgi:tetratricopeptide (TPR) repeat protein